jgi:Ca2+-binding EF-hand superfamily protein
MRWWWLCLAMACSKGLPDPAQEMLEALDSDGSGGLSVGELASVNAPLLHRDLDVNRDGSLDAEELRADLDRWDIGVPKGSGQR